MSMTAATAKPRLQSLRKSGQDRTALAQGPAQNCQLIKEDRFYTQVERDNLDDVDPVSIRETLRDRGIVNGQVVEPEKLDNDPFIRQVVSDAEQAAAEPRAEAPEEPEPEALSDAEYARRI